MSARDETVSFFKRYERHISTAAFVGGFMFDAFTLPRVDQLLSNVILTAYLCLVGLGIIAYNAFERGGDEEHRTGFSRMTARMASIFPPVIQFTLGAVMSGTLVFYSRSASFSVSWPFLAVLLVLALGNELFRTRYSRTAFQLIAFFVASFLYASFAIPIVVKNIATWTFFAAGAASLVLTALLSKIIRWVSPRRYERSAGFVFSGVFVVYALFNFLYFANLIPPLPLSLREIGIYHSVSKNAAGAYVLSYEPSEWYQFETINPVFHLTGNPAYVFSSVFAPTDLHAPIVHEWFQYDQKTSTWISRNRVQFLISGGREGGYRGYSYMDRMTPGKWRVDVKTEDGRIIGRTTFTAKPLEGPLLLEAKET